MIDMDPLFAGYRRVLAGAASTVAHYSRSVVMAALALTALCLWYIATHFAIDTDTSALLSRDLGFQQRQQALDRAFPQLDHTIVVVIDNGTPGQTHQAAAALSRWLDSQPDLFTSVYQPGGGAFFASHGLLYLSTDQLSALGDRLAQAQPLIATLAADPSLAGFFSLLSQALDSSTGNAPPPAVGPLLDQVAATVQAQNQGKPQHLDWQQVMAPGNGPLNTARRFLIVRPQFDYHQIQPAAIPIARLREAIRTLHIATDYGVRVRLTGSAVLDNDQLSAVSSGASWATGLAVLMIVVLLVIGLRRFGYVAAVLVTLFCGLIWTTAFALLAVGAFNILSVAFAVLFMGLSVDFGIQYCMRSREVASDGVPGARVLAETSRGIGGALTLAGLASAASFYSVVPTDYAGLSDLGKIAGTSMLIAVIANLLLLPALLHLFRTDKKLGRASFMAPRTGAVLERHSRGIVILATLVGLASIPIALGIRFDFNPLGLQDQNSEAVRTLDSLLTHSRFSPYTIDLLRPDLAQANALAERLRKLPTVDQVLTLDSYVPANQQAKLASIGDMALILAPSTLTITQQSRTHPGDASQALDVLLRELSADHSPHALRLDRALTDFQRRASGQSAAYRSLRASLLGGLPYQLSLLKNELDASAITRADLPADLARRYVDPAGHARVEVFSRLDLSSNANLARFVADVQKVAPDAAGTPVLLVEGGRAVTHAFAQASITALLVIGLLLWLVLGRLSHVAIALSPLPLAGLMTMATMRLLGLSFNLANIIVLPLLIGLCVAYGIYFVMRWQEGRPFGQVLASSTPAAVLFSALTTMASFGSLSLADSPGMVMLGETLSLALAYILLTTLVVLPAVLSLVPVPGKRVIG